MYDKLASPRTQLMTATSGRTQLVTQAFRQNLICRSLPASAQLARSQCSGRLVL